MVDIAVKSGAAWVCRAQGHHLADALQSVHISDKDNIEEFCQTDWGSPVLLEQTEEGSPCVLTLRCDPCSPAPAVISHLLVISEARTMEVYSQMGEYCGTVRGNGGNCIQLDNSERGPFYNKQLVLEQPSSACEVKLLSLAGRRSVAVCRVVVGLQRLQPCLPRGPGIDMQQVQCLVEEMGTSLSPGAQNLMDMVHFQQRNQARTQANLLPLLMSGGVFSALAQGTNICPAALSSQLEPGDSQSVSCALQPPDEAPLSQNGAMSDSSSPSSPGLIVSGVGTEDSASHAQLAEMMSRFLKGQVHNQVPSSGPELLPMLQNVCGQVTKLRLDETTAVAKKEEEMRNGTWELDSAMEHSLGEMERRLKEYVDRRMDALEQKLERAILSALPHIPLDQGAMSSAVGEAASLQPLEQTSPSASMH
ncbi:ATPase PAAT [Brachionichthys hirsutus]|uniref:ATPase PAAT n=1 Tax=Brachionichthys hirsutus TaxID=412623 RepID=UPI00360530FF